MDSTTTFKDYCVEKKIDIISFQKNNPELYSELSKLFIKVHPNSFTEQKKFLINRTRRAFPLKESTESSNTKVATKKIKPIIPRIKK